MGCMWMHNTLPHMCPPLCACMHLVCVCGTPSWLYRMLLRISVHGGVVRLLPELRHPRHLRIGHGKLHYLQRRQHVLGMRGRPQVRRRGDRHVHGVCRQ